MDFPATAFGICHPTYVNCNLSGCESRPQPEVSGYNLLIKFPDPKPSEVPFSHIGRLRAFELTQIRCVYIHIVHILYI